MVDNITLGTRTRIEWLHDFILHKGFHPDDRELDYYIEEDTAAKLRFFAEDLTKATDDILAKAARIKRDAESNAASAFNIISEYSKEYEAKTEELLKLKQSLEIKK